MNIKVFLALAILFATTAFQAAAADKALSLDISQPGFAIQKQNALNAVEKDENYAEIGDADREKVKTALALISEKLVDDTSYAALPAAEREQLLSQQKLINTILVKAARDSKVVCRDEVVSGSNLPRKVCRTRAAHREYARMQREEFEKSLNGSNRANTKVSDATKSN